MSDWSDDRVERLKKLAKDGFSAAQIAKDLRHVSRSAVIGKLHRLGIALRGAASTPAHGAPKLNPPAPRSFRAKIPAPAFTVSATRVYPLLPAKPLPVFQPHDVPETAKPWTERAFSQCAFPVSGVGADVVSCCTDIDEGEIYCPGHKRLMYVAPRNGAPRTGNELARALRRYVA